MVEKTVNKVYPLNKTVCDNTSKDWHSNNLILCNRCKDVESCKHGFKLVDDKTFLMEKIK